MEPVHTSPVESCPPTHHPDSQVPDSQVPVSRRSISPTSTRRSRATPALFTDGLPWLLAAAVFAAFCAISLWQWNNFVSPSWDLGIFTQLIDQYSKLNAPIVDIKGPGYNLWGDHFHPILLLLTPLYWLFPSGLTLLIAQNFLFAISIVPVAWLARRRLGSLVGTLLGLAYALSWGLWNAQWVQFHEISFAVPLLAFGLVAWLIEKRRVAFVCIALLVFVKEDLGLTVAAFAAVAFWEDWGRARTTPVSTDSFKVTDAPASFTLTTHANETQAARTYPRHRPPYSGRRFANLSEFAASNRGLSWIALGVWGVVWFVLTITVILPAFNSAGRWDYTNRLDSETAATGLLDSLVQFITPEKKLVTVLLLIALGAIVAVRSPLILVVVPTLAWRFAGNVEYYWGWTWHYSAVLMPIVIVAAIDAFDRIRLVGLPAKTARRWRVILASVSLASAVLITVQGSPAAIANGWYVDEPADSRAALESIPDGASVASDIRHLAYLVPEHQTYWIGNIGSVEPDFWISSDEKSASAMEHSAAQRWGGTWTVADYGTVLVATPDSP